MGEDRQFYTDSFDSVESAGYEKGLTDVFFLGGGRCRGKKGTKVIWRDIIV